MKQPSETNPIVRAAGIVLFCRDPLQFLLMRHPDRWDLPKGHCEAGESMRQAALRETEEETGIAADQIQLDPEFSYRIQYPVRYPKRGNQRLTKQVEYFLGFVDAKPQLQLTEHESAQWRDWRPPHQIQAKTIDPLLAAIEAHWLR